MTYQTPQMRLRILTIVLLLVSLALALAPTFSVNTSREISHSKRNREDATFYVSVCIPKSNFKPHVLVVPMCLTVSHFTIHPFIPYIMLTINATPLKRNTDRSSVIIITLRRIFYITNSNIYFWCALYPDNGFQRMTSIEVEEVYLCMFMFESLE